MRDKKARFVHRALAKGTHTFRWQIETKDALQCVKRCKHIFSLNYKKKNERKERDERDRKKNRIMLRTVQIDNEENVEK